MVDANKMFKGVKTIDDYDEVIDELMSNDEIKKIVMDNDLGIKDITKSINTLLAYVDDITYDENGNLVSKSISGTTPILKYVNDRISIIYKPLKKEKDSKIISIEMPEELLKARLSDYSLITEQRRNLYHYARSFINSFDDKKPLKGLYLFGSFRSGKTYLASAIGNDLAEKGKSVIMVYYPELSSYLKSLIGDELFQEEIGKLKACDLLILDDFGGEAPNPFIRDEALGVVLNYRMIKNKPIIITSNVGMNRLMDTTLRADGSEAETIKARRIYERIKELTTEYALSQKFDDIVRSSYEN